MKNTKYSLSNYSFNSIFKAQTNKYYGDKIMVSYSCPVCGYIHEGPMPSDFRCPRCNQPASAFIKLEEAPVNKAEGTKADKRAVL